jgi:hypothetical protein
LGYGIEEDEPCPSCNGTGEVEEVTATTVTHTPRSCTLAGCRGDCGICSPVNSRSVQRREALQKGEPMPEFDKPEMPERIWAKDFPEAKQPTGKMGGWVEWSDTTQTEYLRADKVRELVRLHEDFRDLLLKYRFTPGVPDELNAKAEEIDNLQSALFPEGVENEQDKD